MQTKLPEVGTTIFTVMSKMAQDYDAINLSQGFPDFECPERLKELITHHLHGGKNQYPPMAGVPELRQQIADKVEYFYNYLPDPVTEITVTSGATEALFDAVQALVHAGDEVIVFDPAYDSYEPAINLAGGVAVHVPLGLPDYTVDWDHVRSVITQRTRMIIINTPHNPCGTIWSVDDFDELSKITKDNDLYVLSDEVYEHMVFDGKSHTSVLSHQELRQRSIAVFSFGKTFHATGWKVAYCVAPEAITSEIRKIHQYVTFTTSSFVQYALADFMQECPQHAIELPDFYQVKRDQFCELLNETRFKFTPSQGTYFQLVDYSTISGLSDLEFCNELTQVHGVAAIPLSPFYKHDPGTSIIRFCFCKHEKTLQEAAMILKQL